MKQAQLEGADRFQFSWPEPLIFDLVEEHYRSFADLAERAAVCRLHAKILRDLFAGHHHDSLALRLELVGYCKSRGIGEDAMNRADRAVFWELTRVVETQFRNSDRKRREVGMMLHSAFAVLSPEAAPTRAPVPTAPAPSRYVEMAAA